MLLDNLNFKSLVGQEGEFFGKALSIIVTKSLTKTQDVNLASDPSPIVVILISVCIGFFLVLIGIKTLKSIDVLLDKKKSDSLKNHNNP
jgi:hypothetical protein